MLSDYRMNAPFTGRCKKHNFTLSIDEDIVLDGMSLLFTTIIVLLYFYIFSALNRTFYAIMKKNDLKRARLPNPFAKLHQKLRDHLVSDRGVHHNVY